LEGIDIARTIVDALEDKKGEDIILLDLREIIPFTDYYVVCSGTSDRMLRALMQSAVEQVKSSHSVIAKTEGEPFDGWLLADFGSVVLHVFSVEQRQYYRLEELWSAGKVLLHLQ
jgi:ribosome-associated protein